MTRCGLPTLARKRREWIAFVSKGVDPSAEEERQRKATRDAERRRKAETFGNALNEYLKRKSKLKSAPTIKRELSRECAAWMNRAVADISPQDVKELIEAIRDSGREAQAHAIFSRLRAFLNWATVVILVLSSLHAQS